MAEKAQSTHTSRQQHRSTVSAHEIVEGVVDTNKCMLAFQTDRVKKSFLVCEIANNLENGLVRVSAELPTCMPSSKIPYGTTSTSDESQSFQTSEDNSNEEHL